MPNPLLVSVLISGCGMMLVATIAAVFWWRFSRTQLRWFWVGAGLWTISVILKIICALLTNEAVLTSMKALPHPLYVALGALFVGVQSSVFEMGFTLLAVLIWRQLGRDAGRAIAIGVGAGAFEAFLIGLVTLISAVSMMLVQAPEVEQAVKALEKTSTVTPLIWLIGTVERTIAILCHASTRALILLGVAKRKYILVFWGFVIFTLLDGIAGGAHVAGLIGKSSMWWIELAILPFGLISIPILVRCYQRWGEVEAEDDGASEPEPPQDEEVE